MNLREAAQARRQRLLRRLGVGLSAIMVVLVVSVFGLIVRTEWAHDEARCPFQFVEERSLGEVRVVEERRRCLPELEERRYLVLREGKARYELARKRLRRESFEPPHYQWSLSLDPSGQLVLRIALGGELASEFHEQDVVGR